MEQAPLIDSVLEVVFYGNDIENGRHCELFRGLFAPKDLGFAFASLGSHDAARPFTWLTEAIFRQIFKKQLFDSNAPSVRPKLEEALVYTTNPSPSLPTPLRIPPQNLVQLPPLDAILKFEPRRQLVQLILALPAEQLCKLPRQILAQQALQHHPLHLPLERPDIRILHGLQVLRHHLLQLRNEWPIDLLVHLPFVHDPPKIQSQLLLLCHKPSYQLHVRRLAIHMHHPLIPDILIQPNTPADILLRVDPQLLLQHAIAALVRFLCIATGGRVSVHGPKLAVPHRHALFAHIRGLALEGAAEFRVLCFCAGIGRLARDGEALHGVIVARVDGVRERGLRKLSEVHGVGVAVDEEDMVRVDGADGFLGARVPPYEACVLWVGGLVEQVIACDCGVAGVVGGDGDPEGDGLVLEDAMLPEKGLRSAGVGVPVLVLAARDGVEVEDHVEVVLGADGDDAVEHGEAGGC